MAKSVERIIREMREAHNRAADKGGGKNGGSRDEPDKDRQLNNQDPDDKTKNKQDLGGPSPDDETHAGNQKSSDTGSDAADKQGKDSGRGADKKGVKLEAADDDDDDKKDDDYDDDDDDDKDVDEEDEKDDDDKDDDDYDDDDDDDKKNEEVEIDVAEHVDALLNGEDLSEEFKAKATTIFEAALKERAIAIRDRLEQDYADKIEEGINEAKDTLVNKVEDYLSYVVETWMQENELAIENGLRSELAEEFIVGLRDLFESHYIDVPDEKYDLVEGLTEKLEETEQALIEQVEINIEQAKQLNQATAEDIVAELSEDLAATEKEKFGTLINGIDFEDSDTYRQKLSVIKENYFSSKKKAPGDINESTHVNTSGADEETGVSGPMGHYVKALSRTARFGANKDE